MKSIVATLRSSTTGHVIAVEYNASEKAPHRAQISHADAKTQMLSHGESFSFENLHVSLQEKKLGSMGHGLALTIRDGRWEVQAWSKPFPNPAANPGKALLDIKIAALYDADLDIVAPHGLIGQSYDGDNIAVDGAQDSYQGREVTTKAMGEGAIEGTAADYKMS